MAEPVTVAITRQLEAGHEAEMVSWLNAGIHLAERFPGFLGAGWVRPEADSDEWHMLYRFADHDVAPAAGSTPPQRAWWRASASGLGVVEARVEKRTGIEGWFDVPDSTVLDGGEAPRPAPPRWKQACTIFLVFFPLSLAVNYLLAREYLGDVAAPAARAHHDPGDDPGDDLRRAAVDHAHHAVVAPGRATAVAQGPG